MSESALVTLSQTALGAGRIVHPMVHFIHPQQRDTAMNPNIGTTDRIIRIVAGLVILTLGFFYGSLWGLVGLVPLGTALVRWCPAYLPFGLSTCRVKNRPAA